MGAPERQRDDQLTLAHPSPRYRKTVALDWVESTHLRDGEKGGLPQPEGRLHRHVASRRCAGRQHRVGRQLPAFVRPVQEHLGPRLVRPDIHLRRMGQRGFAGGLSMGRALAAERQGQLLVVERLRRQRGMQQGPMALSVCCLHPSRARRWHSARTSSTASCGKQLNMC